MHVLFGRYANGREASVTAEITDSGGVRYGVTVEPVRSPAGSPFRDILRMRLDLTDARDEAARDRRRQRARR